MNSAVSCERTVAGITSTETCAEPCTIGAMNFEAVLFDCDGVLVDSEAITCGVLRDMFEEQGWRMTLAECMQRFVGHTVKSQREVIEANTGVPLTDAWLQQFFERRNERLERQITAIDGIHDAVAHLHDHCDGRIAVASGADRFKVEMMLRKVGLHEFLMAASSVATKCHAASRTRTCTWRLRRTCRWRQHVASWSRTRRSALRRVWRQVPLSGPMPRRLRLMSRCCRLGPSGCSRA